MNIGDRVKTKHGLGKIVGARKASELDGYGKYPSEMVVYQVEMEGAQIGPIEKGVRIKIKNFIALDVEPEK